MGQSFIFYTSFDSTLYCRILRIETLFYLYRWEKIIMDIKKKALAISKRLRGKIEIISRLK